MLRNKDSYGLIFSSKWSNIRTSFMTLYGYMFMNSTSTVLFVGVADGRLIEPMLEFGNHVTGVEKDTSNYIEDSLESLQNKFYKNKFVYYLKDFLYWETDNIKYDVVCTSCSWHYKRNQKNIKYIIEKMKTQVKIGGIFFAEYMYKDFDDEMSIGFFPLREEIAKHYFQEKEWKIIVEFYSPKYLEDGHEGNPSPHFHKLAYILVKKIE